MNFFYFGQLKNLAILAAAFALSVLLFVVTTAAAHAIDYRAPEARLFELRQKGAVTKQHAAFIFDDPSSENGGTVTLGDVDGDSRDEIIIAAGPGQSPYVRVYNKKGTKISEFLAYEDNMRAGVYVASGDLDNDGTDEIVVGTGRGGGPQVRIFDMQGNMKFTPGFFAYDEGFRGGVNVAVGNIDGKGGAEIITGAGPGGGPHVRVFNKKGNYKGIDFFPFASDTRGGVSVATANIDGGNDDEVIMGIHSFGHAWVKVYKNDVNKTILGEFKAYPDSFYGGVNVAGADVDGDGKDEVLTSVRQSGGPQVRAFEGHGKALPLNLFAYESDFRGGVSIGAGDVDADNFIEVVTVPQKKVVEGRTDHFKYIEVDLSDQTLRAYRNGIKENEFLVSTGLAPNTTPTGEFEIFRKVPLMDFVAIDQDKASAAYYETLEDVHYSMEFLRHYYLHEAYWHNNFGNPMSHGCVNISYSNVEWLYNWADYGDAVVVQN